MFRCRASIVKVGEGREGRTVYAYILQNVIILADTHVTHRARIRRKGGGDTGAPSVAFYTAQPQPESPAK